MSEHTKSAAALPSGEALTRIKEIRARLAAVTPGRWSTKPTSNGGLILRRGEAIGRDIHIQSHLQILPDEDAVFIAHAPEDIAYLLDAYAALLEERTTLLADRERLDWCSRGSVTWTPHNDDPNWTVEWPDQYSATGNSADGPTLRAAIDAARSHQEDRDRE